MQSRSNNKAWLCLLAVSFVVLGSFPIGCVSALAIHGNENIVGAEVMPTTADKPPEAEPHTLEGAMNIPSGPLTGSSPSLSEDTMFDIMTFRPDAKLTETQESLQNGESNKQYIETKQAENKMLPDYVRHKTLTEIWQKETPCECPFHVWRPVCGVDGNTYPTECFARCIEMPIFVHADCKFVQRELWARMKDNNQEGKVETDPNEMCAEEDDDGDDPRPKCKRELSPEEAARPAQPIPFPEDSEWVLPQQQQQIQQTTVTPTTLVNLASTHARTLRGDASGSAATAAKPTLQDEEGGKIELREYNGMRVPYYTGPVSNPCPQCAMVYRPVCGSDDKTYPSACFATCVGAQVQNAGECKEFK